uniref:DN1895 n=2 Tax=Braconinae TaxID=65225 RepID=A0A455LAS1_9HYME|nr:DN1895 [Habrobracon hebetor]
MQNQCLIMLGLCLALSIYTVNGCIHIKPFVLKEMEECYKKFNLGMAELLDFNNQPEDDIRFKKFAHCFYVGIGYLEGGKLSATAPNNVIVRNAGEPEDEEAMKGFVGKAAELIEKANEYSDEYDKAWNLFRSTQEPENNKKILSFVCEE